MSCIVTERKIILKKYSKLQSSDTNMLYIFFFFVGINWQLKAGSDGFNKSLASLLVLRGQELKLVDTSLFQDKKLYTSWGLPENMFLEWSHPRTFKNYEKSASLLSNSQSAVRPLSQIIDKAWGMFAARAYVHQYVKHGLAEEDFVDSFATLEQIRSSYMSL